MKTKKNIQKIEEDRVVSDFTILAQKGAQITLQKKVYLDFLGLHKQAFCA